MSKEQKKIEKLMEERNRKEARIRRLTGEIDEINTAIHELELSAIKEVASEQNLTVFELAEKLRLDKVSSAP